MTTAVACHSWLRSGHCTRPSSAQHSRMNWMDAPTKPLDFGAGVAPATEPPLPARVRGAGSSSSGASMSGSSANGRLAGLAMRGVLAAVRAELVQLDAVRRVALGLLALVVAVLAVGARHGDRDALARLGHVCSRWDG